MSEWFSNINMPATGSQPWFQAWREQAKQQFEKVGLPAQKQEKWRYAPLKALYADHFESKNSGHFSTCPLKIDAHFIQCKNQKTFLDALGKLPKGVVVLPLVEAIEKHPELVRKYLSQVDENKDGFYALNSAVFEAGVFIYIPENVTLEHPIVIHHQSERATISHFHHLVVCERHAKLNIIEYFDSVDENLGFINHVSEFALAESADCQHLTLQLLSPAAKLQSQVWVNQQTLSNFESFWLQKGGQYSSCDAWVNLNGEHAKASLNGVFKAQGQQVQQQRINISHIVPHCQSSQNFRGILDEHAHGVFIGQVEVFKDAIKTEAHQSNKNLLLSKYAQMTTCPQLQIFADDVICSHGATVGQLEEDALFYLQARGLSQAYAKKLLVQAFMQEPVDGISNEIFKKCCVEQLDK